MNNVVMVHKNHSINILILCNKNLKLLRETLSKIWKLKGSFEVTVWFLAYEKVKYRICLLNTRQEIITYLAYFSKMLAWLLLKGKRAFYCKHSNIICCSSSCENELSDLVPLGSF